MRCLVAKKGPLFSLPASKFKFVSTKSIEQCSAYGNKTQNLRCRCMYIYDLGMLLGEGAEEHAVTVLIAIFNWGECKRRHGVVI